MSTKSFQFTYFAKSSGNFYPIELGYTKSLTKDLVFDPDRIWKLCKTGCKNFNFAGGCPPRSTPLNELHDPHDEVWVIYARFWSKYKPEKVAASRNIAIHWKFTDVILARFLYKLGRALISQFHGDFLSTGYCMGCPGKKCNYKLGYDYCRNPHLRTFSLEATGIDVVQTMARLFNIPLFWYTKGRTDIPYMVKCIGFFPKEPADISPFIKKYLDLYYNPRPLFTDLE